MKLKTLKDFGTIYTEYDRDAHDYSDPGVLVKELKQEAIKWLNDKESYEKFDHSKSFWLWVFMNFFNIKEEDLK